MGNDEVSPATTGIDRLTGTLSTADPALSGLIGIERERQQRKLILIASESICLAPVREALDSVFTNLYAEGYPSTRMSVWERDALEDHERHLSFYRRYADRRYYKGCEYVDLVESLAQRRIAHCFATEDLPAEKIFANVQPLSGAAANNAVYTAFLRPGDTVMGMALNTGGHLTHGSPVNRSGIFYDIVPYTIDPKTGQIDFDELFRMVEAHRPKLIIAGYSAYPWDIDWGQFRAVADASPVTVGHHEGAILLADIAHTAGLVAAGELSNPIEYADVVAFTTHKTLCGPRGAVLLSSDPRTAAMVDAGVFPGEQGGPHINAIAAKAVSFSIARSAAFKTMMHRIIENTAALAEGFEKRGLKLAYGGTESHLLLLDLKALSKLTGASCTLDGETASRILDICGITVNKNTIYGDENAAFPSAIRLGTTWLTQRGFTREHMDLLAEIITDLLTGICSFEYIGPTCTLSRGKVEFALLERTKKRVAALIDAVEAENAAKGAEAKSAPIVEGESGEHGGGGYPYFTSIHTPEERLRESPIKKVHDAEGAHIETRSMRWAPVQYRIVMDYATPAEERLETKRGAALHDGYHYGILEVRGDGNRVRAFLNEVLTTNIMSLEPQRCARSVVLDKDGAIIDDIVIARIGTVDPRRYRDRYLLFTHSECTHRVKNWLRACSDGHVIFDRADLHAKIDGPVVVSDRSRSTAGNRQRTLLELCGETTLEALRLHLPGAEDDIPAEGGYCEAMIDERPVELLRIPTLADDETLLFILSHPDDLEGVWNALLAEPQPSFEPVGLKAIEARREEVGLPLYYHHAKTEGRDTTEGEVEKREEREERKEVEGDEEAEGDEEHEARSNEPSATLDGSLAFFEAHPTLIDGSKPYFIGKRPLFSALDDSSPLIPEPKPHYEYEAESGDGELRRTPLFEEHLTRTNKRNLVPFAGWEMPIKYGKISEEHEAVRTTAGLFDVAHMGAIEVAGECAARFLDLVTSNYVTKLRPGESAYSYLLYPDGTVLDDIFIYCRSPQRYLVIVNAVNAEEDLAWLEAVNSRKYRIVATAPGVKIEREVTISDLKDPAVGTDQRIDLALQGPESKNTLMALAADGGAPEELLVQLDRLERSMFIETELHGIGLIISRTGYTGEAIGYEFYLHPDDAPKFWNLVLEYGEPYGVRPVGLGARDSTRIEAGFPLHGHELAGPYDVDPIACGYGAFLKLHKPFYIGRNATIDFCEHRKMKVARFTVDEKGAKMIRMHDPVVNSRGKCVGHVTSCALTGETQTGLAIVQARYAREGTKIGIFPLPRRKRRKGTAGPKSELAIGERTLLHVDATVLSRFLPSDTDEVQLGGMERD